MATTKVGIYRKYHGPIPKDSSGQPLPKSQWAKKRPHSWAVRWFGADGKRYSKSFRTRKEAERYAETKQTDVRSGKADPPVRIPLKAYYREHRDLTRGNLARTTLHLHLTTMELLAGAVGWDRTLEAISVRDIERFRATRLQEGLCPSSANKEVKTLRRVFNLAILRGYLPEDRNPCRGIPTLRVAPKRPKYVSPAEFELIFRRAPDAVWEALLLTLYTTGIRKREALHLRWQDLDFEESLLHVTRRSGGGFVQAWTPKDHEMRSIPLPDRTVTALATWQSVAPEASPYVFMDHGRWEYYRQQVEAGNWDPSRDLTNNVLRRFKTLCRRAGVGHYTIHDLRRSCITNWAKELPIHVVQQLAGHSDINTTRQFYLSVQPEDMEKAKAVQASVVTGIPNERLTDPKVTHSGQKRAFPGRQGCKRKSPSPWKTKT